MGLHGKHQLTLKDGLSRDRLMERVVDEIYRADTPRTLAIHGDWGSGKSSFLAQLEWELTHGRQHLGEEIPEDERATFCSANGIVSRKVPLNRKPCPVVWFEAWKHQHDPNPVVTLLHAITKRLNTFARTASFTRAFTVADILQLLPDIEFGIEQIKGSISTKDLPAASILSSTPSVVTHRTLETAIKKLLEAWEPNQKKSAQTLYEGRLVILIDDLDRCDPTKAKEMLEALKVHLQIKHVVFVFALDEVRLLRHLEGKDREHREEARGFIEKLFQSTHRLPFPSLPTLFFRNQLFDLGIESNWESLMKGHPELKVVPFDLPPNPRKLKLLAQTWARTLEEPPPQTAVEAILYAHWSFILAYCHQFEPDVYRMIDSGRTAFIRDELLPHFSGTPQESHVQCVKSLIPHPELTTLGTMGPAATSPGSRRPYLDPGTNSIFYPSLSLRIIAPPTDDLITRILHSL